MKKPFRFIPDLPNPVMLLRLLPAVCLWVLTPGLLTAQTIDFNDYRLLRSEGQLPVQFETSTEQKVQSELRKRKKDKTEEFIVETSYSLDRFLSSGKVLFNTSLNIYATSILQHIFEANGIEEDMEVYIVQTDDANAYAGNENIIFVTTALIAQAETEAELAFILCHEYTHYSKKHVFNTFLKEREIDSDYRKYKRASKDFKQRKAFYSRKLEEEADMEGLQLFLKTRYNLEASQTAFEVLRYSDLPFSLMPFPKTFFETEHLVFPAEFFMDTLAPITDRSMDHYRDEDSERLNTHPALNDRKENVAAITAGVSNEGRVNFVLPASEFYAMRKVARYEMIHLQLLNRDYENALYNSFVLLQDDPQSIYLQKTILKSLYGLATYSNRKKLSRVHQNPRKKEGELQQVAHFIHAMSKLQLNYLALHYAWGLHKRFPQDMEVSAITDDIFRQSRTYHKLSESFFKTELPQVMAEDTLKNSGLPQDTSSNIVSKYSQIKKTTSKSTGTNKVNTDIGFIQYAFADYMQDPAFRLKIKETVRLAAEEEEALMDDDTEKTGKKNGKILLEAEVNSGKMVEDVLFFDPTVIKLDLRKNKRKKYASTEKKKQDFISHIQFSAKKADLEVRILSRTGPHEKDVETLNDIAVVSAFISERMDHDNIQVLPTDQERLKEICEKYEVNNIGYIGMLNYVESPSPMNALFLLTPLFPYGIYKLAFPKTHTVFYVGVYSMITNNVAFSDAVDVASKSNEDVLVGQLYDLMIRLKNTKK